MRPTPGRPSPVLGTALAVVLLGSALAIAAGPSAEAAPAPACPAMSLNKEISQADVVFRGLVDHASRPHGRGDQRTRTYTVTADRVYQASLVTDRVRVTAGVGARCAPPTLKEGKRYVFFVTEQGSRLVSTPATARATRELTSRVEAKLGSGKAPSPPPPADPEFRKVADAVPAQLSRLLAPGAALVVLSLLGLFVVSRVSRRTT